MQYLSLMSIKHKVASNTIFQVIGKFITAVSTLLGTAIITRYLGAETFGEYSIVTTYILTFYLVADFGVNALVTRDFANDESLAKSRFPQILSLRILFGIILIGVAAGILVFFPYAPNIKLAILLSLPLILFNAIFRATSIIFQAFLKYRLLAIASGIGSFIGLALLAFIVFGSDSANLYTVILALLIGSAITPLIGIYFVRDYITSKSKWIDKKYWIYVVYDALPLGLALILNVLLTQADRLILSIISTSYSVGIYSLGYKIFEVMIVVPTFFMNAMYPVLIKLRDSSNEKYHTAIKSALWIMAISAVLLTIPAIIFSAYLIPLIWGSEMSPASAPFNVLMLGSIAFFVSSPLSWVLVVEKREKVLPYLYGGGFLLNVVLNLIFIPKYDYMAAAYTTIFTEVLILVVLFILIRDKIKLSGLPKLKI